MGHPTERENAQEPTTTDEVSTPPQPTPETPLEDDATPAEGVPTVADEAPTPDRASGAAAPVDAEEPSASSAATPVESAEPVASNEPSAATPVESAEPVAPNEPSAATPVEPVASNEPSAATPAESAAPVASSAVAPVESAGPVAQSAVTPVESAEPVASNEPSAATPVESTEPAEPVAPSVATPAEPVAPSVATPAEPVAPSVATPAESTEPVAPSAVTPAEPAAPSSPAPAEAAAASDASPTSPAEARHPSFDDDDVPYSPRVFAFEQPVPVPVVPTAARPADEATGPAATAPVQAQPAEPARSESSTPGADSQATQVMPPVEPVAAASASSEPSFAPAASAWTNAATSGAATTAQGAPDATPAPAPPTRPTLASAFTPVGASTPSTASSTAPSSGGPSDGGSPLDGFSGDKAPSRLPKVALWAGVGVLVLGGLYTGAQWFYSDKVPPSTTVAGVDIGGLDEQAAVAALEKGLGGRAAEPITLEAAGSTTTLDPAAAGLAFDAQATADELTSFSMSPAQLWKHVFGGGEEEPVTTTDPAKLEAQVAELKARLTVEPVDGNVVFTDGKPVATLAQDGASIIEDESIEIISTSWLTSSEPLELPTTPQAPDITQEETDAALAQAESVVSAPVTVAVGGQQAELTPDVLVSAASFNAVEGSLQLAFDGATLLEAVVDRTDDLLNEAADAKFVFVDGAPAIEGGAPGTTIDPAALSSAVSTAALGTDRTAAVELVESDPEQSVAALEALGVKEKISEFSTPLTNDSLRTENLRVGASKVNGTLVKPGETFSLIETLSPITTAGGYHSSGIVQDGKHVEGIGGGLSQMATTTYNAGFFAGLEDVEHRQHSYWFSRYPAGREATIFVGSIDMKFKNDTPYGVLMQSWVGGGKLHVAIWSTKYYEVQTTEGEMRNVVQPTTVTHSGADCVPQPKGNPGFTITTPRKVLLNGEVVKDEKDTWTYKPDNQVVCEP
ncbi:VanW family protein [Oerskovia sp. Sa1BUA8]|uniref:VanW family protein n=1 Tax=Oerskovia douganii TaxID=2762210 RepID=A0A9D5UC82_9CELL|nr:VanW family protein [Oerskovia douganii]MBE7700341.1 VanW family protein [Oerskovia douganii]